MLVLRGLLLNLALGSMLTEHVYLHMYIFCWMQYVFVSCCQGPAAVQEHPCLERWHVRRDNTGT